MSGFDTTRWSLVLNAGSHSRTSREALELLCRTYRPPVLAYVRRRGYSPDAAEDLVQTFFVRFIENSYHDRADPARGRFRAFLLTSVKRFLIDRHEDAHRLKRGGGIFFESLDSGNNANLRANDDPEVAFERDWAIAVLDASLARLRAEAENVGKLALFEVLSEFITERPDDADYARASEVLNLRRNTVAVAVHRMRHRLRELVREEIGETTLDTEGHAHEMRDLRTAFITTLQ